MAFNFSFRTFDSDRERRGGLALLLCSCLLCVACASGNAASSTATSGNVTRYAFRGVVKAVHLARRQATIKHEKVGDYMEPMTMPFLIKDEAVLKRLQPGDAISATLVVTDAGGQWLENISIQRALAAR